MMMKRTSHQLCDHSYNWSVLGAGKLAESNAQQVSTARSLIEGLGLEVAATLDEARAILRLKGGDRVEF